VAHILVLNPSQWTGRIRAVTLGLNLECDAVDVVAYDAGDAPSHHGNGPRPVTPVRGNYRLGQFRFPAADDV
jgi:hypothetical protein